MFERLFLWLTATDMKQMFIACIKGGCSGAAAWRDRAQR
jgi:hypothetical protein